MAFPQPLEVVPFRKPTRIVVFSLTLILPAANFHVEADYAVLVADGHNGNIVREVVLDVDDMLGSLLHSGTVGDGQIVGDLLFNRDQGTARQVRFRAQALRVDLD